MAFCNNRAPCGHGCGRQDAHGGPCDCYESTCPVSARRKGSVNPCAEDRLDPKPKNLDEPYRIVRHSDLKRANDESPFRSVCPVCEKGVLLVRRWAGGALGSVDNCTWCGQMFFYTDEEIAGEKLVSSIPLTLDETVAALDAMLSEEDRAFLQKSEDPEGAAVQLHHTLGRHLRNNWGLWRGSPLALHFRENHGIDHPDDMSGKILRNYTRARFPTRYQRIMADED